MESFIDTDQKYLQHDSGANRDDGCTAVTAVLVGQRLVVANVGDSRAVLSRNGKGTVRTRPSCSLDMYTCTVKGYGAMQPNRCQWTTSPTGRTSESG